MHHVVKNKGVTVQGPVKKPQMNYMSHRGSIEPPKSGGGGLGKGLI